MISNCTSHFRIAEYLARHTRERIGIALGIPNLRDLFDETHYRAQRLELKHPCPCPCPIRDRRNLRAYRARARARNVAS